MSKTEINCELKLYRRSKLNNVVLVSARKKLKRNDKVIVIDSQTMFFDADEKGVLASRIFENGREYFFIKSENVKKTPW